MSEDKAKSINLLLYEGNLNGVISIEDSKWNSGELYSAPRESILELLETDACNKYGVYLLLSANMVYVGQASDLAKRITQHIVGKEWWENVVILTTKDDSLNHSDIDYLETVLIEMAQRVNRLDCDNKKKGNNPKVDKFRKVYLTQYLKEALFLMQLIGINVFNEINGLNKQKSHRQLNTAIDVKTRLTIGKRAKNEAIILLNEHGIHVDNKVSYAVKQENKDEFWINPNVKLLEGDWFIILNNNVEQELIVLSVPANTFSKQNDYQPGLIARVDKPEVIDLNINANTFIDRKSGIDFSPYVVRQIKY